MKRNAKISFFLVLFTVFLAGIAYAAVTNSTTMTWVIPSNKSHTLAYGGSCSSSSFYFIESNGEDSDIDGNSAKILPYSASSGGSACQADDTAGITVTNNGNVTINLDANMQIIPSGTDRNVHLKVWMGTGGGCGTSGFGGWEKFCTITGTTSPVTSSACKDFNASNATTTSRLVTNLLINDTNQLCFSGDITCDADYSLSNCLAQGTYTHAFDTNAS